MVMSQGTVSTADFTAVFKATMKSVKESNNVFHWCICHRRRIWFHGGKAAMIFQNQRRFCRKSAVITESVTILKAWNQCNVSDGKEITAGFTSAFIQEPITFEYWEQCRSKWSKQKSAVKSVSCDIAGKFYSGFSLVKSVQWDIAITV
jgi:hypothetical protein